jgi:16S rRNA (cytosine967-C5)-methyltransferase
MDLYESKLKRLKSGQKRWCCIEYRIIDSTKIIKIMKSRSRFIDALQRLRSFKRNPDAKWKLQPEFIDNISVKYNQKF